jgi:hypothetical protein
MSCRRVVAVVGVLALSAGAIGCGGDSPTGPGPTLLEARLANLQARQLGLLGVVCDTGFQYVANDELTFDVETRDWSKLEGATVHHVQEDGTETLVGQLNQCVATVTPCSRPLSVCLLPGSTPREGQVRIWAQLPWTPVRRWTLFVRDARRDTNRVSAEITRPDGLPHASAGIAFVSARRLTSTTGSFDYVIWSPGIRDRRIFVTREVWSNGVRLSSSTINFLETIPTTQGTSGAILIGTGSTELIVTIEERTLDGLILATDKKSAVF